MMISFNQINITGGIMVSFWVNYWLKGIDPPGPGFQLSGWRIAMLLQCVPALVLLLGSLWLPRSPRWLAQQGRTTEALSALQRLRGAGDVADAELQQIVADCSGSSGGTAPWSDFLYDAPSRRRLLCGVVLQTGQMLCGIDSIMFYGPQIFAQAAPHIQNADLLAQGINGVVNFLSTFVAVFLLDKVGRRPLLGAGAAIQASCMLTLATVGVLYARIETNTGSSTGSSTGSEAAGGDAAGLVIEHRSAGVVCILAIYLFVSAFAWSWGPVVWALCVEVFPTRQRVRGVSITTTVNWLFNIVVGQLYPPAQQALGFRIFFVFGGVSVLLSAWVLWSAPETKGLSIDQVETLFERPADAGRLAGRQRRESFRSLPATTGTHAPLLQ
jgi:sugar porter (SP) family MFS transporter